MNVPLRQRVREVMDRRLRGQAPVDRAIFVQLAGGLGNQLFGFAAGWRQAKRLEVPLVLAHASGAGDTPREFELDWLLDEDVRRRATGQRCASAFLENSFRYDPRIEGVLPGTNLKGHFQSSRYFGQADALRQHLIAKAEENFGAAPDGHVQEPFIGVHVRRGDYRAGRTHAFHGLCSPEYFARSATELRHKLGDLPVVVFSDDWEGIETGLAAIPGALPQGPDPARPPAESLFSLSRARAIVMSNSSFSWWAAWLAAAVPVIAPTPWFTERTLDTSDLYEPSWIICDRQPD